MGNLGADLNGPSIDSSIGFQTGMESVQPIEMVQLQHARDVLAWAASQKDGERLLREAAQMDADCAAFAGGLADKKEFVSPKERAEHYNACMTKGIAQNQRYFDLYKPYGYNISQWSVDANKYEETAKFMMEQMQEELKAAKNQRKADQVKLELRQSIGFVNNWLTASRLLALALATGDSNLIAFATAKVKSFERNSTGVANFAMSGVEYLQSAVAA
jgi:hypothetical protein